MKYYLPPMSNKQKCFNLALDIFNKQKKKNYQLNFISGEQPITVY